MNKTGQPSIVVIGGGTGTYELLTGLKEVAANLTALVSMADSGGSTGQLRDELGALPPGDVRKCLVALAREPKLRDLFDYRFPEEGHLVGHSFGNLFLTAVEQMTDNFAEAVELASHILNVSGRVLPITLDNVQLVIEERNGRIIRGEAALDKGVIFTEQRPDVRLEPTAKITEAAAEAIRDADLIVIAPGSLYGSLAAVLVVEGVIEALQASHARKAFVCNLVSEQGQTDGFGVHDYAAEIERFLNNAVQLDYVLYNTHKPAPELLARYAEEGRTWVPFDRNTLVKQHYRAMGGDFVAEPSAQHATLIRHNPQKMASLLLQLAKRARGDV